MNEQKLYEEIVNWLDTMKNFPAPTLMARDNTKWTLATGNIIGPYQHRDLEIARKLRNRSQRAVQSTREDVDNLLQSPANVLSMLSTMARTHAGFDAKQKDLIGNYERYETYVRSMLANPMLFVSVSELRDVDYKQDNYGSLINNLTTLFDSITEYDAKKIKDSAMETVKTLTSTESAKVKLVKFTQDVIESRDKHNAYLMVNTSGIEFDKSTSEESCSLKESYKTKIQVDFTKLKLNTSTVTRRVAEKLLGYTESALDTWICEINPLECEK